MERVAQMVSTLLGLGADDPSAWQTILRAIVVYGGALLLVRLGEKRFLGKSTAFDMVVAIMLGSVVSRGITGSAPLGVSLVGGATLVAVHWLAAALAFRSDRLGNLLKGTSRLLITEGELQWNAMRKSNITRQDLMVGLRNAVNTDDVGNISRAYLERSGDITAIKQSDVRVVEIEIAEGVQTVRIELKS